MSSALVAAMLLDLGRSLESRLIRRDPGDVPYLWRSYLGGKDTDEVGGFLHRFVSSDALTELHCHPWSMSVSFILEGSYVEHRALGEPVFSGDGGPGEVVLIDGGHRIFRPGDQNFIGRRDFHRVELLSPEVWTLFLHGRRVQPWGFVPAGRFGEVLPLRIVKARTFDRLPREAMGVKEE